MSEQIKEKKIYVKLWKIPFEKPWLLCDLENIGDIIKEEWCDYTGSSPEGCAWAEHIGLELVSLTNEEVEDIPEFWEW